MRARRTIGFGVLCAAVAATVVAPADSAKGKPVIGRPALSSAHPLSSKRFTLTFPVRRSDTRKALSGATVVARAKIGRLDIAPASSFRNGKAIVSLLVPPDAMRKVLEVKVIVTTRGAAATRKQSFTIVRGQPLPRISITDDTKPERPVRYGPGGRSLSFYVTLSAPDVEKVEVSYATHDGTAVAPGDYEPVSGKFVFDPGARSYEVSVDSMYDTEVEPDETFTVELSDPVNGVIARGTGTGTITAPGP